jgi:hypothetical protein
LYPGQCDVLVIFDTATNVVTSFRDLRFSVQGVDEVPLRGGAFPHQQIDTRFVYTKHIAKKHLNPRREKKLWQ